MKTHEQILNHEKAKYHIKQALILMSGFEGADMISDYLYQSIDMINELHDKVHND